jgi:hypothetical protein
MKPMKIKNISEFLELLNGPGVDHAKNMPLFLQDLPNIGNIKFKEARSLMDIIQINNPNHQLYKSKKDPKIKITKFAKSRATVIFGSNLYRNDNDNDYYYDYERETWCREQPIHRRYGELLNSINTNRNTKLRIMSESQLYEKKEIDEVDPLIAELELLLVRRPIETSIQLSELKTELPELRDDPVQPQEILAEPPSLISVPHKIGKKAKELIRKKAKFEEKLEKRAKLKAVKLETNKVITKVKKKNSFERELELDIILNKVKSEFSVCDFLTFGVDELINVLDDEFKDST